MTKTVVLVDTGTDTFQGLVNKVNELANLAIQEIFTSNTNANGAVTSGNAQHTGIISANTLGVKSFLRGGNVQTSAAMNVSSNVIIMTGNTLTTGNTTTNTVVGETGYTVANTTVTYKYILPTATQKAFDPLFNPTFLSSDGTFVNLSDTIGITTSGASIQIITSWIYADIYSAEYSIVVKDNNANNLQISKVMLLQDEGESYITEYAITQSNSAMGSYDANANATHVRLYFTPTSTSTDVRIRGWYTNKS